MPLDASSTKPRFLDTVPAQELRTAIDLVATLRLRITRNCLFGTLILRPDPTGRTDEAALRHLEERLRGEIIATCQICRALGTGRDMPNTSNRIAQWINSIVTGKPNELAHVMRVVDLSQAVETALDHNRDGFGAALNAYMDYAQSGFIETITSLCDAMWDVVADHQATALVEAKDAANTLGNRLTRLEHIGRHVRLVSLNASVEAAHAGDLGKGLMVIAQEFKELAEEIQILAKDAHADMAAIS